jgi:hypothetical protein
MMIGNGLLHRDLNTDTGIKFAYGHGLIDEITWAYLEHKCCHGCVGPFWGLWHLIVEDAEKKKETE